MDIPGAIDDAVFLMSSWKGARLLQETANRNDENNKKIKDKFYALW